MRQDSPRWEQINPSPFAHERDGLHELASYLPDADPYHVWANVEFVGTDGSINEVDALVLTPGGLYILELKHWQGELGGDGTQWVRRMPRGRLWPTDNPYILANRKAKRLASLIRFYARQQGRGHQAPYVGAAVFLHARNFIARLDEIGRQHAYGLDGGASGLPSLKDFLLSRLGTVDRMIGPAQGRQIIELVRGAKIRPSVADRKLGQLLLHPKPFAEGIGWQDFLAGHALDTSLVRRVRFYLTSRASLEEVPLIRRAAEREFRLLQGIHHPGIAQAVDLADHPFGPAVVFAHDRDAVRLDTWLTQHADRLTLAQRLQMVQDLAEIIDYAHSRRLVHRALQPHAVFVTHPEGSRPAPLVTDWQTGGRLASATLVTRLSTSTDPAGLELFFDDEVRRYQAPEAATAAKPDGVALDVFALGVLAYRIFAGAAPADTPEELLAAVRDGGLNLAAAVDGMPDSLVTLVYDATRGDPAQRLATVADFRRCLDAVWEELTAPEAEPVANPLDARAGDLLDCGLTVVRRLGAGATSVALLVTQPAEHGSRELVLKVARDEQHTDRLRAEAETLRRLQPHWQVAALVAEVEVGGRFALLLQSAGPRTLADELRGGRLALGMLERYGRDLLDIVTFLEGQGVSHRDIKPANLAARPRPKDKQPHLCVFDFSLSAVPAGQITAGTPAYLDPFLGPPKRMRYDAAAERFAAAVTLYEMATGALPRWGDNANPAVIPDEVTLEPSLFDPAVADLLVPFFARALARDAAKRFDTAEQMADAWRMVFVDLARATPEPAPESVPTPLGPDTPLETLGLTPRARSALERLGVHTLGELLAYDGSSLTRAQGVPDATRREILAKTRDLRLAVATPEPAPGPEQPAVNGIEAVCATLLPEPTSRRKADHALLAVLLGQQPTTDGRYLRWLSQGDAARAIGSTQPQISTLVRRMAKQWLANPALSAVRTEIIALLDARGAVMSAEELADALVATRGSYTPEPRRTAQAMGLVRAAVDAELARGGDARLAVFRFRGSESVLVGREPEDPAATTTADDLLAYAVRLGRRAAELAALDPLPTRQRAVEELRAVRVPETMPALSDQRLLSLAAAASNGAADANSQGQLYPVGMPAERALRLAAGSLIGQRLSAEMVQSRVRARFPEAETLPRRPRLDHLLAACGVPLSWDTTLQVYAARSTTLGGNSTRAATQLVPLAKPDDATEAERRLADTIERHGFLALLTPLKRLEAARRTLLARLRLEEVNVTGVLLKKLRAQGFPWEAIAAADTGEATDADFQSLVELVRHQVVPALREALTAPVPVLLTEAAPLARYGQLDVLAELTDQTRPRPAARLLLVPVRRPEPAMLDRVQLPLTSPGTQALWLPDSWLPAAERADETATRTG